MADDGRLSFLVELNNDEFTAKIKQTQQAFDELGRHAEQEGKNIDDLFQSLSSGYDVSTIEGRMDALRKAIAENESVIRSLADTTDDLAKKANKALSDNDIDLFNTYNDEIIKQQKIITETAGQTEYYRQVLARLEKTISNISQSTSSAPMFYVSEEDYNRVKEMEQSLDELQGKLSQAGTDDEINTLTGQIIDLQAQLDEAKNKAVESAAALGSNLGTAAAETSTRLYELNSAVTEQQQVYDDLVKRLQELKMTLEQATADGDTDKVRSLQLEYQRLSEHVQNAGNTLATLQGEQKDASDSWESMLEVIGGGDKSLKKNNATLSATIGSVRGLAGAFTASTNPIALFRATLTALQSAFRLVAAGGIKSLITALRQLWATMLANPITALLVAIAALATGIVALINSFKSAAEKQAELNKLQKAYLDNLQAHAKLENDIADQTIAAKQREIEIAKAQGKSQAEINKLIDEQNSLEQKKANANSKRYKQQTDNLEKNRKEAARLTDELKKIDEAEAKGDKKVKIKKHNMKKNRIFAAIKTSIYERFYPPPPAGQSADFQCIARLKKSIEVVAKVPEKDVRHAINVFSTILHKATETYALSSNLEDENTMFVFSMSYRIDKLIDTINALSIQLEDKYDELQKSCDDEKRKEIKILADMLVYHTNALVADCEQYKYAICTEYDFIIEPLKKNLEEQR